MKKAKRVRLEAQGWQVGSVARFLDLNHLGGLLDLLGLNRLFLGQILRLWLVVGFCQRGGRPGDRQHGYGRSSLAQAQCPAPGRLGLAPGRLVILGVSDHIYMC